jgi:hypothetical protein
LSFDFVHFFPNMRAQHVHAKLLSWFVGQGAKVTTDIPGSHLVVEHGKRTALFDNRIKRKTVDMWFFEAQDGTSVRAMITPSVWYADEALLTPENFLSAWGAFMEEAWAAVR